MLPGKTYSFEDIMLLLRRRYWLLAVPMAVMGAVAADYTRGLPNVYAANTVIMIQPQQIPSNYVQPTQTAKIEDRLPTLRTTILSRTNLERIIGQYNLYPAERRAWAMEDVVSMMTRNIRVDTATGNSFKVEYQGSDPVTVMKVTDSLAALFVDGSLRDRRLQAEGTNQFLDSQLAEARQKLEEHERRLAAWKVAHAGELPTQYDANLQQVTTTQMALRDVRESMNQDRMRRLELERQLADLQNPALLADLAVTPDATGTSTPAAAGGTAQQLAVAEAQVAQFEQRGYRTGHPDLDAARRRVRDLQTRLQAELAATVSPGPRPAAVASPGELARLRRMDDLRNQIALIDKQLAKNTDEERRLMAQAADAQRRADSIPTRETEYTSLTRDYETLRGVYTTLLANKQQSQIAANLENRQVGEQFKLVDPARLPERPVSPDRRRDIAIGLLVGLLIGAGSIVALEHRDRSFRTDRDVAATLNVPVLAVVPVMKSETDLRTALWRRLFVSAGLGGLVVWCVVFVLSVAVGH